MNESYPLQFAVDYPDRELNRVSTAFRIFAVIPIGIVLATIGGVAAARVAGRRGTTPSWSAAPACCSSRRC